MLLVEPKNSEEAELNFMVICLPVSTFHGSSFAVFALNQNARETVKRSINEYLQTNSYSGNVQFKNAT